MLEANLAALENGKHGICFASGMAAMDAVFKMLSPGDEVIASNDLYGGSYRLITKVYGPYGIKGHFIGMETLDKLAELTNANTKLIWIETPNQSHVKYY